MGCIGLKSRPVALSSSGSPPFVFLFFLSSVLWRSWNGGWASPGQTSTSNPLGFVCGCASTEPLPSVTHECLVSVGCDLSQLLRLSWCSRSYRRAALAPL